jgi:N-acetylneuraminate lyase
MKSNRLTGLIAAPFTPFKPDFSLNLSVVPQLAEHLVTQKVAGAFIGGTTGEWPSLSTPERRAVADAWRKVTGPNLKLIVHVGHNSLVECQDLARHANSIGADAISALAPCVFRPATLQLIVDFCRQIAAAAPQTPFYYYHMPDLTGVNFNMAEFLPLARESIPTFSGIKFTHSNLMDFGMTLADAGDHLDVLFGRDEYLLAGLALGAKGAVGSTYNHSARLYHKLMEAHAAGFADKARDAQVYVQRLMVSQLKAGGVIVAGKAIMAFEGIDCGPPRPPFAPLVGQKLAAFKAELDALDFFAETGFSVPVATAAR